jgi:hypothetical protein
MFLQRAAADYAPLTRGLGRMLTPCRDDLAVVEPQLWQLDQS